MYIGDSNHLTGTNGINSIGSKNDDFLTGWPGSFNPTQYGSTISHPHHHHTPTGTIAYINGANMGNDGKVRFSTGWAIRN